MSKRIAFHSYQLGDRGTEVAMYKYAKYNQDILGNESLIISTSSRPTPSLPKFQEFKVDLYPDIWINDGKNNTLRNTLEKYCDANKIDAFYAIKGGESDGIMPTNAKSLSHAVFRTDQPHGSVYAGICEYISKKHGGHVPFVYHIIEKECPNVHIDMREQLNIPKDAVVLGRYGGNDTFSLGFVHNTISSILDERPDIWFIFLNTNRFIDHERVIFLPWSIEEDYKAKFVNTCDAMIHARYDGEIFSMAIAEFNIRNKPIITWKPDHIPSHYDYGHLYTLGERAIFYKGGTDLRDILLNVDKKYLNDNDWDVYKDIYSPKNVITQFDEVFLK